MSADTTHDPARAALAHLPATAARPGMTQATTVESSRAVAEVQAAVLVALQYPRDTRRVHEEVLKACRTFELAKRAFYAVPNRGAGSSVHLARELARCYGHVQYGVHELSRDDAAGMSEIRAFAWDPQTGVRQERTFQVPHQKMVGKSRVQLDDLGDVYRNNQNVGARAVRECIFGVLPAALVAIAERECRATLEQGPQQDGGGNVPLPQWIAQGIEAFALTFDVGVPQLEARLGVKRDRWTAAHAAELEVLYRSLQQGEVSLAEAFPAAGPSAADVAAQAVAGRARRGGRGPAPAVEQPAEQPAVDDVTVEDPPGGEDFDPTVEPGFGAQ